MKRFYVYAAIMLLLLLQPVICVFAQTPAQATTLEIVSGNGQNAVTNHPVPNPLVVKVKDQNDNAMAGVTVTFFVAPIDGQLSSTSETTDSNGEAQTELTVGDHIQEGENTRLYVVSVSVAGLDDVVFTATAKLPIATTLETVSGDGQSAVINYPVPNPLVVKVKDQDGNLMPDATVQFSVSPIDGQLSSTSETTDSNGEAQTELTVGGTVGTYTVTASVTGISESVTFTATAMEIVNFPDANLAAAVRDALGLAAGANILIQTLETNLMTLSVVGNESTPESEKISNLEGLQYAANLRSLTLTYQALTTLAPITNRDLLNLRFLDVSNNQLNDEANDDVWESIRSKRQLERLLINHNELTKLQIFSLDSIEIIEANYNAIRSVLIFSGSNWPDKLELTHNGMTALPTLLDPQNIPITGIRHIDLSNNQISDLSQFRKRPHRFFPYLTEILDLSNNQITDISAFRPNERQIFRRLKELYLGGNTICDLRPLAGMTALCYVEVDPCPEAPAEEFADMLPMVNSCNPTLEIVSGDGQSAFINRLIAKPFVVRVKDHNDNLMKGVSVDFSVSPSDGQLAPESNTTNENGEVQTMLTLGSTVGRYTVTASVTGTGVSLSVTFTATALALPRATTLEIVSGDGQSAVINQPLPNPFVVSVKDQYGALLSEATVTFSVSPTSGRLNPTSETTNTQGKASTRLQLGNTAGIYTVTARVTGIAQHVTFRATAIPEPTTPDPESEITFIPTTLEIVSGNEQSAMINQPLPNPLVVKVKDQNGNTMRDITVYFFAQSSDAQLTFERNTTNENGETQTELTLGNSVSIYTVTASVIGISKSVTFTATAAAPPSTRLEIVSGNEQSAPINQPLANPLVVKVTDKDGNALTGADVYFFVKPSDAQLTFERNTTNENGETQTSLTLGKTAGTYTVTASVTGVQQSVWFTATATATAPTEPTPEPIPEPTPEPMPEPTPEPMPEPTPESKGEELVSAKPKIVISEIMFETKGDIEKYPQWIEFYNYDTYDVNLNGWEIILWDQSFAIESDFIIKPNTTVLLASHIARFSENINWDNLWAIGETIIDKSTLNDFLIRLYDDEEREIDHVSILDLDDHTRWELPNCIVEEANDARTSIIRRFSDGEPVEGYKQIAWIRASEIKEIMDADRWYGHNTDIGTPVYRSERYPMPVLLSLFTAKFDGDKVFIDWTTESEIDNAGFNIYRSETRTGQFRQVNAQLIQGAGTTGERNVYTWRDTTAKPNVEYYYRIEDVSHAGNRQTLATVRTKGIISAKDRLLTQWGALKR